MEKRHLRHNSGPSKIGYELVTEWDRENPFAPMSLWDPWQMCPLACSIKEGLNYPIQWQASMVLWTQLANFFWKSLCVWSWTEGKSMELQFWFGCFVTPLFSLWRKPHIVTLSKPVLNVPWANKEQKWCCTKTQRHILLICECYWENWYT